MSFFKSKYIKSNKYCWVLYLYGSRPNKASPVYFRKLDGYIPSKFVRLMALLLTDSLWVKEKLR